MSHVLGCEKLIIEAMAGKGAAPGSNSIFSVRIERFGTGEAIAVVRNHEDNRGPSVDHANGRRDAAHAICEILTTDPAHPFDPRLLRFVVDQLDFDGKYAEREFKREASGQVVEAKPMGGDSERRMNQKQFDSMRESMLEKERL